MNTCPPAPQNKKEFVSEMGRLLVKDYGKKKFYSPEEVKSAYKKSSWHDKVDFACWAMAIFSSHEDFDAYHTMEAETCDYTEMRTDLLAGMCQSPSEDWTSIADLDIDASWLDFGDVFDGILDGIGDFIGAIFEAI